MLKLLRDQVSIIGFQRLRPVWPPTVQSGAHSSCCARRYRELNIIPCFLLLPSPQTPVEPTHCIMRPGRQKRWNLVQPGRVFRTEKVSFGSNSGRNRCFSVGYRCQCRIYNVLAAVLPRYSNTFVYKCLFSAGHCTPLQCTR